MKAIVWTGLNSVEYTDLPEPVCKAGWVKIKVMSVGLCATELHMISGKFDGGRPPHVLGHEICGNIVELGEGCDAKLLGKRAVVETYVGCGECELCRSGRKHLCSAGEIGYPPYMGGDAQYVVVPKGCVRLIPDCISYDEGAIIEAVACPFGAIVNSGLKCGQSVLIQGAGVAGLSFIQAARVMGAAKLLCTVRNEKRATLAAELGAQAIDLRRQELLSTVLEQTGGMGVDVAIDAIGSPETIAAAFSAVKSGGLVLLYGIPDKSAVAELPVTECILREIHICGYTGNERCWDPLITLAASGKISLKKLVSASFPLSRFNEALALLSERRPDIIKLVLHPWED